jgi:hypothetical protein
MVFSIRLRDKRAGSLFVGVSLLFVSVPAEARLTD